MTSNHNKTIILGGGLSGLTAGYMLTRAGRTVSVIERDHAVGGLSRTMVKDGFRFDLGGHRFVTKDRTVDALLRDLMAGNLISVSRSSKIFLRGKYFDYPLKPLNAMFGMGVLGTARILADYAKQRMRGRVEKRPIVSLEDWVGARCSRSTSRNTARKSGAWTVVRSARTGSRIASRGFPWEWQSEMLFSGGADAACRR